MLIQKTVMFIPYFKCNYSYTKSNIINFTFFMLDKKDADRSKTDDNKHHKGCSN